jgi:hypothetical protein
MALIVITVQDGDDGVAIGVQAEPAPPRVVSKVAPTPAQQWPPRCSTPRRCRRQPPERPSSLRTDMPRRQHEERIGHTVPLPSPSARAWTSAVRKPHARARCGAKNTRRNGWLPTRPYRCTLCGNWHLATIKTDPELKRA